ncbi:hypothetical protein C3B44_10985 [Corynebacterium yudongzhengii]|uniref:Peptidoglycan recognition protein family domain-containing protein n=1 Tax=Corynebacterium yudongzhengii TaxID=2080740 RepID=A0A2U1T816_9CORY|nr:hypothetical protein C3B44_10985 [Corynebacterium yudongzhengii]PWC02150.1 hypothetical protein DF222_03410 [Corynebacterium yudongzhengii]
MTAIVALVATMAFGGNTIYQAQSEGGSSVEVNQASLSFADGDNVLVDDAAIASQGGVPGPKTVKEFTSDEEFSMFALTWERENADFATYVRAENDDGEWGPWYAAAPMEEVPVDGKMGTDLIYVEPTNRVQVSVAGVDLGITDEENTAADEASLANVPEEAPVAGAGIDSTMGDNLDYPATEPTEATEQGQLPDLPSDYGDIQPVADAEQETTVEDNGPIKASEIETVLIDPDLEAGINEGIDLASTTDGMPNVVSRAGWSANENLRNVYYNEPVSAVTVHHTAGSNNYSAQAAPGIVRGIQTYHGQTLGWGDIGYNALVDKYGQIYEGRAGGLDRAVQGAHVGGFNGNTWGVSVLGNYETAQPSQEALNSLGKLAGWKAAISGFDPTGQDRHYAEFDFNGSRYSRGQGGMFPNINAHRDFHYNACPGQYLYAQMDTIRSVAKQRYDEIKQGTTGSGQNTSTTSTTETTAQDRDQTTSEPTTTTASASNEQTTPLDLIANALNGDIGAILAIAGSIAGVVLAAAAAQGATPGSSSSVGDIEIFEGLKISDLPPIIDGVVSLSGDSEIERTWKAVYSALGPVLGESRSGETTAQGNGENSSFALFDNGIIVSDDDTGTQALWGAIADAWAGQGFDAGPLGMPTSSQLSSDGTEKTSVEFEGGSISYDPETNHLTITTN